VGETVKLDKAICKMCRNKHTPIKPWNSQDERSWRDDSVECPMFFLSSSGFKSAIARKEVPAWCKYSLEHLMAGQSC
jgi:hypothetical protein